MMIIGFFTSRVILNALGISDLGVMNVAGSVIAMFTFLNSTLASGTQRFLTYGLGEGNIEKLKQTFANAMTLHLVLAIIILILGETAGLWYVNNKLNVPEGRESAAMWCYQLSILSTCIGIILVPFNASIVAHEKMGMYAYMSIYDAVCKLLAAFLIQIVPFDRLIFYSTLSFLIALTPTFIYNWYCRKHFEECGFRFGYDKSQFKEMLTFSGWNIIGCLAAMGQGTGVELVVNSFCGTAVNGAKGIASQANGWITRFVHSFLTAVNPQITKNYASENYERMSSLVCYGATFGSYLLLFLGVPLFIEIEWVLNLWLGQCPEHTPAFMRIMMIQSLFHTIGNPTVTAMHATGRMKEVNLTVAVILLTIVPMSYLLFKLGCTPETVMAANVIPWIIVPFVRVLWVNKFSGGHFPVRRFLVEVYLKTVGLGILMFFLPMLVKHFITGSVAGWLEFIIIGFVSCVSSGFIIFYLGFDKRMRRRIILKSRKIALSIFHKK